MSAAKQQREFIEAESVDEGSANEDPKRGPKQDRRESTGPRARVDWAIEKTREQIRKHPLPAVGGAFALGFVLGNGVPKFLARTAVTLGLRMVLQRVVADAFGDELPAD